MKERIKTKGWIYSFVSVIIIALLFLLGVNV